MRDIVIFSTGLILGAAAGALGMYKYMKGKGESALNSEEYDEMLDKYRREPSNEMTKEDKTRETGPLDSTVRSEMKARANLVKHNKEVTMYNKIYDETIESDKEEFDSWERVEPYDEEDEEEYEDDEEEIDPEEDPGADYHAHEHLPTKAISYNEMMNLPSHVDRQTFYLYANDVITDEEDNVVHDFSPLFDNVLEDEGFYDDEEESVIFIMNYNLDVCYEVQKVNVEYGDWEE